MVEARTGGTPSQQEKEATSTTSMQQQQPNGRMDHDQQPSQQHAADGKQEAPDAQLSESQQASMRWLSSFIDQLAAEDKRSVFQVPVCAKTYPQYYQIIQEPMCFATMKEKLQRQQYRTLQAFRYDVLLIFENAR